MHCSIADSTHCPVVVESKDLSAFAAHDLRVRDRAAVKALIVIGSAPLLKHCPGHSATAMVD